MWKICLASTLLFFFQAEDGIRDLYVTGSSDVCSSDLDPVGPADVAAELLDRDDQALAVEAGQQLRYEVDLGVDGVVVGDHRQPGGGHLGVVAEHEIGRASCRERV